MLKTASQRDQVVSRIIHTQQSMKTFLGGLQRQSQQGGLLQTSLLQIHSPDAPPVPDTRCQTQAHHHSFQRKVRDAHTWVPCAVCTTPHCSTALHYLHLPSLTKPWIPLCSQCAPTE